MTLRSLLTLTLFAFLGTLSIGCIGDAVAAPKFAAQLYAVDGGPNSDTILVGANSTVQVQCPRYAAAAMEFCYKTGNTTPLSVDCNLDPVNTSDTRLTPLQIQMAGDKYIAFRSTDAGTTAPGPTLIGCTVDKVTFNPAAR